MTAPVLGPRALDDVPPVQPSQLEKLKMKNRCSATNRFGGQCQRYAYPGTFVCWVHGAKSPLVRDAAKRRLLAMCEPAFEVLMESMESEDEELAFRAACAVLDRAGLGPKATVALEDNRKNALSEMSDDEITERAKSLMLKLKKDSAQIIEAKMEGRTACEPQR